jgi:hypothetical protein
MNEMEPNKDVDRLIKTRRNMPAKTKKQRTAMAIAKHHPEKLYPRNKGMLKMSQKQLGDFSRMNKGGVAKPFDHYKASGAGR